MMTGRLTMDANEVRRVTVDFSQWLDAGEAISSPTPAVITIEQVQIRPFLGTPVNYSPPADSNPLVQQGSYVINSQQIQLFLTNGTPGLTYKVAFFATGSTSTRTHFVEILVTVRVPL